MYLYELFTYFSFFLKVIYNYWFLVKFFSIKNHIFAFIPLLQKRDLNKVKNKENGRKEYGDLIDRKTMLF